MLDRDAIVIGDGGDFVSYAGRYINTYQPGAWMDPGPFGCLGAGPGQAIGAAKAHPGRQICLLLGDGAFGFSGMELDTMEELDDMLGRARAYAEKDERVDLVEKSAESYGPLTITSFYVGYLLPMMIEVQHFQLNEQ